jgi:hypothetical protein
VAAHEGPLLVVEGGGLGDDGVGDRDRADVVERGGVRDLDELLAVDARAAGDLGGELGDPVLVAAEVRVPLGDERGEREGPHGGRCRAALRDP